MRLLLFPALLLSLLACKQPPAAQPASAQPEQPSPPVAERQDCKGRWCLFDLRDRPGGDQKWWHVGPLPPEEGGLAITTEAGTCWVRHDGSWSPRQRGKKLVKVFGAKQPWAITDHSIALLLPYEELVDIQSELGPAEYYVATGSESAELRTWVVGYTLRDPKITPFIFHGSGAGFERYRKPIKFTPQAVWADAEDQAWIGGDGGLFRMEWGGKIKPYNVDPIAVITSIHGRASDDVWAVGTSGFAAHWDGKAWTRTPSPVTDTLNAIWVAEDGQAWAVGNYKASIHWTGNAWERVSVPSEILNTHIGSVWGTRKEVWAAAGGSRLLYLER